MQEAYKIYKVDTDGYLIEDLNLTKEESDIMENYNFYTEKIDEMISQDKLTIISINDTYKQLNEIDNDIIDMRIDDDEYGLLFKDKEEKERNKENIIILNSKNYTLLNTVDTPEYLLEKFLESYYYDDEKFLEIINTATENTYSINDEGYLIKPIKQTKASDLTQKLNDYIDSENTIVINISNTYKGLLNDNMLLDFMIERTMYVQTFDYNDNIKIVLINPDRINEKSEDITQKEIYEEVLIGM